MALRIVSILILVFSLNCYQSHAAIQALRSRVIYNEGDKSEVLNLKNNSNQIYMVQSWIDSNSNLNVPFVVIPPILKIEPSKENILKFVYSGSGLPDDRESLFWINIQEIPPKVKERNVLQIAVRSKIKLFFRPKKLNVNLSEAIKKIKIFKQGNTLKIENNSPLFVTIGDIFLNENTRPLDNLLNDMISPYETIDIAKNIPSSTTKIRFSYINEYGGNVYVDPVVLNKL